MLRAVRCLGSCAIAIMGIGLGVATAQGIDGEPTWAYGVAPQPVPGDTVYELPGAPRSFTLDEIRNVFGPADWYPGDHPEMPDIVANGRFPRVWACALCHYPNGKGRPENAPIAGLPVDYFIRTMKDFQEGRRASAQPRKFNTNTMIGIAQAMTDEEIVQAAEYYGSMPWTPYIRVVETEQVPIMRFILGMYVPVEGDGAGMEPLGLRIVETPDGEDWHQVERMRDPRTGFIAYVPIGSVEKGRELVETGGNGRTVQCAICHGPDLNGLGFIPGIVGRSPSYFMRQLYDFREGSRTGDMAALMGPTVVNLTVEDMVNMAAYVASLPVLGSDDE